MKYDHYYHIKVGHLYHYHSHYGTRDFPQTLLCLEIEGLWDPTGIFLDVETLKTKKIILTSMYNYSLMQMFTELG
jgi:hypothetical protein